MCVFFIAALELSTLAIKKDVVPEGKNLRLKCEINSDGKIATVSTVMAVNYPPRGGECDISPKTGMHINKALRQVETGTSSCSCFTFHRRKPRLLTPFTLRHKPRLLTPFTLCYKPRPLTPFTLCHKPRLLPPFTLHHNRLRYGKCSRTQ